MLLLVWHKQAWPSQARLVHNGLLAHFASSLASCTQLPWLPLWSGLRGASMLWIMCLLMLASMMRLLTILRGISLPVRNSLSHSLPRIVKCTA
jgi:hypothetical protein